MDVFSFSNTLFNEAWIRAFFQKEMPPPFTWIMLVFPYCHLNDESYILTRLYESNGVFVLNIFCDFYNFFLGGKEWSWWYQERSGGNEWWVIRKVNTSNLASMRLYDLNGELPPSFPNPAIQTLDTNGGLSYNINIDPPPLFLHPDQYALKILNESTSSSVSITDGRQWQRESIDNAILYFIPILPVSRKKLNKSLKNKSPNNRYTKRIHNFHWVNVNNFLNFNNSKEPLDKMKCGINKEYDLPAIIYPPCFDILKKLYANPNWKFPS